MPQMIFINLPVANLAASTRFYEAIGCRKNVQFSDEKASSMIWSDTITFQLLAREYFQTFTPKPVANAKTACQVLLCLSRDSRQDVDVLAERAAKVGGKADVRAPIDMGFLYNRAFEDPDGHVFELVWLNPDALMQPAQAASN